MERNDAGRLLSDCRERVESGTVYAAADSQKERCETEGEEGLDAGGCRMRFVARFDCRRRVFCEKKRLISASEELLSDKENQLNELLEEHADEAFDEDNFADNKLTDSNIKKRIKTLDKKSDADEIAVLMQYLKLKEDISLTKKTLKTLKYNLLTALMVKYADLIEDDIKRLVIEKKWFAALSARLDSEMQRIGQQLTSKVSALAERYAQTLPEIDAEIADLEAKVAAHLKKMGF